ncbi:MAG: hypothetical protein QF554_11305 [Dehalococcoidia bacterium]|jgi:hypothetical protein|nr:hypothetical protein [Dehalococcoidia bacterium]
MSLALIRTAIVDALATVSGLKVYDHQPHTVEELPAMIVTLNGANYIDLTFDFRLLLLAESWDAAEPEEAVLPFLELSGASSICALLNADPGCVTVSAGGVDKYRFAGVDYRGVVINVTARDLP